MVLFFFFKQKTAYEMRISDWSSDVCSSDLPDRLFIDSSCIKVHRCAGGAKGGPWLMVSAARASAAQRFTHQWPSPRGGRSSPIGRTRSEEHTSELQSLMRISYAVFCLKKKKTHTTQRIIIHTTTTTKESLLD